MVIIGNFEKNVIIGILNGNSKQLVTTSLLTQGWSFLENALTNNTCISAASTKAGCVIGFSSLVGNPPKLSEKGRRLSIM